MRGITLVAGARVSTMLASTMLASTILAAPISAFAADATPAPVTTDADQSQVKDIVVTAQRRSEKVDKVAIAITAISGDSLEEKKVVRQLDLQNAAPGLSITKAGLTESINIRGIGLSSGSPNVTNGVATYYDGIFQPPIVSAGQFYDIGSIEVLRGPQGTISGANNTGGAIYINSNKPDLDKLEGHVEMWGGSYKNAGAIAAVNIPVGDTLAIRFAGIANTRDSYYTSVGTYAVAPDRLSERDGRVQALWKPDSHFSALLKLEVINRNTGGYAYQPISTPIDSPTGPVYLQGRPVPTLAPWTVNYDSPTANYERATLTSLKLDYVTDGGLTFRSVTGYLSKRISNLYDLDGTNITALAATQNQFVREREYVQEVNIISPDAGAFTYVLGAYAQRNKVDVNIAQGTGPQPAPSYPDAAPNFVNILIGNNKVLVGVFGQVKYKFTDKFSVEAGLRYSHYHIDAVGGVYVAGIPGFVCTNVIGKAYLGGYGCNVAPQTGRESDGRPTGKFALNYQADANNLIYAFVARGYKNGGINAPSPVNFTPETVWDYEAGWKSSFLNRHLRTQVGVFYNAYSGFQEDVTQAASGSSGVINVPGTSKIYGVEGSAQAKFGGLSVDGGFAYTHASLASITVIDREIVPPSVNVPQCANDDFSNTYGPQKACYNYAYATTPNGGPNLYSPKWTWNANVSYKFALGDANTLVPHATVSHVGSQWDYLTYHPGVDQIAAHTLVNAGITLNISGISIDAYGTNLSNKYYVAGRSGNNQFFGAPREYGVRLSANF